MKALDRKLLRELGRLRGQLISIALVVAAGIMSAITMQNTYLSLAAARDGYYAEYHFAHVFASLKRAPLSVRQQLLEIPGVLAAQARVSLQVVLTVPGLDRPAAGKLVSAPDEGPPTVNGVLLRRGRWFTAGVDDEVVASERFAQVNDLAIGDTIVAVLNGRQRTLRMVGLGMSPEFIYETEPTAGFMSDERLYGVFWMSERALSAAAGLTGSFNEAAVVLAPEASERSVIAEVDRVLAPYGGLGAYGRDDQLSSRVVRDEIKQNETIAGILPLVFLSISAFLLHIVLLRLVATQRPYIGVLKAFGYTDIQIGVHYLLLAALATLIGVLVGIPAGIWLGSAYIGLYDEIFRFPELSFRFGWEAALRAAGISALAALLGALSAVRSAVRLQPAEAMRIAGPARFRPLILERWNLHRFLTPVQRMVLRNVERRPVRALLSAVGVGFALAVVLVGFNLLDSIARMIYTQFGQLQREDVSVVYSEPREAAATREVQRLPGVVLAEPFRVVPVRVRHQHHMRRVALTGIAPGSTLRRLYSASGIQHSLPASGAAMTNRLAHALQVGRGDTVEVELLERPGRRSTIVVSALIDEMVGVNIYLRIDDLNRIMREPPSSSGAWLRVERGHELEVLQALRTLPAVSAALSKQAILKSFDQQMAESLRVTVMILLILAAILGSGVIYNGARIALSERGNELAGLRVLGFTNGEVATMLLGEQAVITLLGIPLGVGIGFGVTALVISAFETELYGVPLVITLKSVALSAAVTLVIAALAAALVRRRLVRADLIAVLKTRE